MKKSYVKPQVLFESFQLSANIAGNCSFKTGHAIDECAYTTGGRPVFVDGVTACTTTPADGKWDGMCYHIPEGTNGLFTS